MKLIVEVIEISKLTPDENNAKEHTKKQIEQIKSSIKKFGMVDPIGIWGEENLIVEGHGRLLALQELGYKEVPIIRLPFSTKEEATEYALIHNQTTMNTGFNLAKLNIQLKGLDINFMKGFDFAIEEEGNEKSEVREDDFDIDSEIKREEPAKTKLGDMYALGNHILLCGDCTKEEDVDNLAKSAGGGGCNLYLTDPPYNVALGSGGSYDEARKRHRRVDGLMIENDNMPDDEFYKFLKKAFEAAARILKNGAPFYIWHADNESLVFRQALKDSGLTLRQTLIWNKDVFTLGRQDYQWRHEPCLYGWKDGAAHPWYSDRKQSTVIDCKRPKKSDEHPTMKPIELFAYLIQNSTQEGDIVFDGFGGSGTTLLVCEQLNRKCLMIELDPYYCDVIIKRWATFTGKKSIKIN